MKVNLIIICIVRCINLFNSFVFPNGTSFLQPAVLLFIVSLMLSITRLHQAVDKTIINTFSDSDIFVNAVQLYPIIHAG